MSSNAFLITALAIMGMAISVAAYLASSDAEQAHAVDKRFEYKDVNPFRQMGKQAREN